MADVSESWTDEFDSLQSRIESHIGPSASSMHPPASRQEGPHMQKVLREERMPIQEIEAELKLLEWHKMANEAALKAALVRTKQLKASNRLDRKKDQLAKKAAWMQQHIEEERTRPLEVTKEYIDEYEKEQVESENRLQKSVKRHIHCLKKLKVSMDNREDSKARYEDYSAWERKNKERRKQLMAGRVPSTSTTRSSSSSVERNPKMRPANNNNRRLNQEPMTEERRGKNMLSSMQKLVELEQRISQLESDNLEKRLEGRAANGTGGSLRFKKRLTEKKGGLRKDVYTVQMNGTTGRRRVGGGTQRLPSIHQTRPSYRESRSNPSSGTRRAGTRSTRGGSSSRTASNSTTRAGRTRESLALREKRKAEAEAAKRKAVMKARREREMTTGQKALRERKRLKDEREAKRKKASSTTTKTATTRTRKAPVVRKVRKKPVVVAKKGMSAPRRAKNKHMQDLEDMKKEHLRRKRELEQKLRKSTVRPGVTSKYTSMGTSSRLSPARKQQARTRRTNTLARPKARNASTLSSTTGGLTGSSLGGIKGVSGVRGVRELRKQRYA